MTGGYLREHRDGCTLAVRVQPGAKRTAILGVYNDGEALRVAVQAAPVEGKANEALLQFLREHFMLSKQDVVLISGEQSRSKVVLLRGIGFDSASRILASARRPDRLPH